MTGNRFWGFIKDPIYGYIRLTETEKRILDTGPVQRLRRIRQLSGAEYVYPAATHTRFEHVLGTMYLAGVVSENLPAKLDEGEKPTCGYLREWKPDRHHFLYDLGGDLRTTGAVGCE